MLYVWCNVSSTAVLPLVPKEPQLPFPDLLDAVVPTTQVRRRLVEEDVHAGRELCDICTIVWAGCLVKVCQGTTESDNILACNQLRGILLFDLPQEVEVLGQGTLPGLFPPPPWLR